MSLENASFALVPLAIAMYFVYRIGYLRGQCEGVRWSTENMKRVLR